VQAAIVKPGPPAQAAVERAAVVVAESDNVDVTTGDDDDDDDDDGAASRTEDAAKEALQAEALAWHLEAERLENAGDTHKALVLCVQHFLFFIHRGLSVCSVCEASKRLIYGVCVCVWGGGGLAGWFHLIV
jgi:hypothetical protein